MMENRAKYIQDLLDKGIIRYKENSESIYYDTSIFDGKKWFELSDLEQIKEINPLINCYIVNSKKGIGKTYQMRKKMEAAEKEGCKFIFVRRLKDDIGEQAEDWADLAETTDWPYLIVGKKRIINKNTQETVGRITTISTLYNQTGKEFNGYKYVFFDEFKDKRGIKRYIKGEFKSFIKFLLDFQRSKNEIVVYMFSNDETKHDPYTVGLRIDASTDYFIDLEIGVFYINLKDKFEGAITDDSVGKRLAKFDDELIEELNENKTVFSDENNIIDYSKGKIDEVRYQFYLNKRLYQYGYNDANQYVIIKSVRESLRDESLITYALTTVDYTAHRNTARPSNIQGMVRVWYNLMSRGLLWFVNYEDKQEIEGIISKVLGVVKR